MINEIRKPKYLTEKDEKEFLSRCKNVKYLFAALIMLDSGLRVSEACNLRIKDINFQKGEIYVRTLKQKKDKDIWRTVYLTDRTIQAAAQYFKKVDSRKPHDYIFPSPMVEADSIDRQQFWRYFQSVSDGRINPHMLRHTYATRLMQNNVSLLTVRDLLGHQSTNTTQVYIHASEERKRDAMRTLQQESKWRLFAKRLYPAYFRIKDVHVLPMNVGVTKFHVGRKAEIAELVDLSNKKVNVLLLGNQGVGKSHLLDNYQGEKVLRIDDTKDFKKTIANCLINIVESVETTKTIQYDEDGQEIPPKSAAEIILEMLGINKSVITTQSAKRLCELMVKVTKPLEYTIIIDKADDVTPSVIKYLEFLRNHFHFIVAARQIAIRTATWLTNFQRIELKPLNRSETIELIVRASEDFRELIEDFEVYKNHIWAKCAGNPQFTLELIDRFRKEDFVSVVSVANIEHTAGRKELDMSLVVLIGLSSFVLLKYLGGELGHDEDAFRLIGGGAIVIALFGKQLLHLTRRKYI